MTPSNGLPGKVIFLLTADCPHWLRDVFFNLSPVHYQVNSAATSSELSSIPEFETPDAIVGAKGSAESLGLFEYILSGQFAGKRPLLILIAQEGDENYPANLADLEIPLMPTPQLEQQIQTFIRWRREIEHLEREKQRLQDDNAHIKKELMAHSRFTEEVDLLKKAFVRNVAHELRTPLLQVKSAVALLAEDVGNTSVLIGYAQEATTRLEAVVKNITLLNELLNESIESRPLEPVLMKEVIDSAMRNLRRSWEHKDKIERVNIEIPDSLPPVMGDKQRLVIALQLLLDNGLKFSEGKVEVQLQRIGTQLAVSIRDHGIGIPKDKLDRIFDPFYQVDSGTTKQYYGMGIGLAIVRFILERHHTSVKVESEVNKGSRFSFSLMVAEIRAA